MWNKIFLLTIFLLDPGEAKEHSLTLTKDYNYMVLVEPENKNNRLDCAVFKGEELVSAEENKSEFAASCILTFQIIETGQYRLVVQNSSETKSKYSVKINKVIKK